MTVVLVVDADADSRRLTGSALRHFGYQVRTARRAGQAMAAIRRHRIEALIIDPDGDGSDGGDPERVLRELRPRTEIPILVVSVPAVAGRAVRFLDAGADDYIPKPVVFDELLARLRVALRRSPRLTAVASITTPDFALDLAERRVTRPDGTDVALTPTEWRLVEVLARQPGHLLTQSAVLEAVWGPRGSGKSNYLRVFMTAVRHKLEPDPGEPRYFLTVPGVGLRFVSEGRLRGE